MTTEEKIATIIADCKEAGTSANETTRQVLEVFDEAVKEKIKTDGLYSWLFEEGVKTGMRAANNKN